MEPLLVAQLADSMARRALAREAGDAQGVPSFVGSSSRKAVRHDRDVLAAIVDSSVGAIVSFDRDGIVMSWNAGAERLFGFCVQEAVGRSITFLTPPENEHEPREIIRTVLAGGEVIDFATVRRAKNGELIDVVLTASPLKAPNGELLGVAVIYHNVTREKAARDELARREKQLNEAQRLANLGSWELDATTGHVEWSDQMFRILGYEPGEVEPSWEIVREMVVENERDRFVRVVEAAIADIDAFDTEVTFKRKDGSNAYLEARGEVTQEGESGIHVSGTALDVTERKRLEEQLIQSQKMEALGGLAGGIAHDFNNLLAVILNYGHFIEDSLPADSRSREDIREMVKAAERGAELVRQLLSFARREGVRPEPMNLNLLIRQMHSLLSRAIAESVDLKLNLSPELWNTEADRGQIEQLLLNLVVNARDAMPNGGAVNIETKNVVADDAFVASRPNIKPGRYVELSVSDSGTGMDKATQERIFEPFFTTKPRGSGTGLGLASVYGIVTRAGGHISVYSEVGTGTTFRIFMPISELQLQIDGPAATATGSDEGRGECVVVVEDEEPVLQLITRILDEAGYEAVPISTPQEALEHIRGGNGVDLLLTDMIMPQMSGRTLSDAACIPTVFMSGYTESVIEQQGVLQQGVLFLPKPFSRQELLEIVRTTLDNRMRRT